MLCNLIMCSKFSISFLHSLRKEEYAYKPGYESFTVEYRVYPKYDKPTSLHEPSLSSIARCPRRY